MITFIVYTIIAWIANASFVKVLHVSIQPGQWLDLLFDYQKRLLHWDMKGKLFLSKAGGNCEICFSHFVAFCCYWVYVLCMNAVLHVWITDTLDSWFWAVLVNVVWYLVYMCIGSMLSLYFIVKLFAK